MITLRDVLVFLVGFYVGIGLMALFASASRRPPTRPRKDEQPYTSERGIW